jgi:MerR family mercuric resistance operon transcriptional regulator
MTVDKEVLSIAAAARQAGVNVETIRYYQRRGLLPRAPLMQRGSRRYAVDLVDQVRFIKRAQQLGFTLDNVAGLLALAQNRTCSETCGLAERKMDEVQRKIADLQAMQTALQGLVARCRTNGAEDPCPLVQALAGNCGGGYASVPAD